jgi:hypothetical protein
LRALSGFGIFEEGEDGRFSLKRLSKTLQSVAQQSVKVFALWSGGVSYTAFGGLYDSVRMGMPAFESLFGTESRPRADRPEFQSVLAKAGFRLASVAPTKHRYSIVEVRSAEHGRAAIRVWRT